MSSAEIIRAWKDADYRSTLSVVPVHPAGQIEFADPGLDRSTAAKLEPLNATMHGCHTLLVTHGKCC